MARTLRVSYTCEGRNDGTCGHRHRTFLDALRCTDARWRRHRKTDRNPTRTDGQALSSDESTQLRGWEETPPEVHP
jgi:hypothetical protein